MLCDESMSAWTSAKPDCLPDTMPHKTKIIRKPKGVGCEIKNLADGRTGVMLQLEIHEGKEAMGNKDWAALPAARNCTRAPFMSAMVWLTENRCGRLSFRHCDNRRGAAQKKSLFSGVGEDWNQRISEGVVRIVQVRRMRRTCGC